MIIKLNYHICIFENMGVVATKPRPFYDVVLWAPLLKVLEITTGLILTFQVLGVPTNDKSSVFWMKIYQSIMSWSRSDLPRSLRCCWDSVLVNSQKGSIKIGNYLNISNYKLCFMFVGTIALILSNDLKMNERKYINRTF